MFRNFLWFSDLNSKINELLRRLQPPFRIQRPNLWYQSKKFTTVSAWAHAITTLLPRRSNRIGSDVRPTPLLPRKSIRIDSDVRPTHEQLCCRENLTRIGSDVGPTHEQLCCRGNLTWIGSHMKSSPKNFIVYILRLLSARVPPKRTLSDVNPKNQDS